MKDVFISICIPAYKRIDFLKRLLDSIAIQSFRDFEVIVTDDSPSDEVELFCKLYNKRFVLYYYKNEEEQDPQVKVSAILKMNEQLATPADFKVAVNIPTAGAHVLGSSLTSKDIEGVYREIEKFTVEKLKLKKVDEFVP